MSTYPATAALPQSGSVVSRWLLDEASSTRADIVGSNTLADNNTVGAGTGYTNLGATFDNAADYIAANSEYLSITDAAQTGLDRTGSLSYSVWAFLDDNTSVILGGKWDGVATEKSYFFNIIDTSLIRLIVSGDGSAEIGISGGTTLSTGTWYLLTYVYEASTRIEVYVNGVSDGTNTTSIPASLKDAVNTYFSLGNIKEGVDLAVQFFDGRMNDGIFWNVALSDAEVTSLYDLYQTATGSSPVSTLSLMGVG